MLVCRLAATSSMCVADRIGMGVADRIGRAGVSAGTRHYLLATCRIRTRPFVEWT